MNNSDKLLQKVICPCCKSEVILEYEKKITQHSFMSSYTIKVVQGCQHFLEGELINDQYVRLLNSIIQNKQQTYNELVESRARRKLQELGINKEDLKGLF